MPMTENIRPLRSSRRPSVFREEVAVGKTFGSCAGLRGFEKIGDAVRRGAQRVIIFFQPSDQRLVLILYSADSIIVCKIYLPDIKTALSGDFRIGQPGRAKKPAGGDVQLFFEVFQQIVRAGETRQAGPPAPRLSTACS